MPPAKSRSTQKRSSRPWDGLDPERARRISTIVCLGLIALGVYWRLAHLGFPPHFSFDEHHFVENARNYIRHAADWNDHPPLGKLVLIPGIELFGDNGLGWRISSAIFGLATIPLAYLVAWSLYDRDRRAGLFAAAFVASDGFFIAYSRTALLDAPLTAFILLAFYLLLEARDWRWLLGAALAIGLAAAVKWTGVCVALMAPFLIYRRHRRLAPLAHLVWMGAVSAAVYFGIFALALALTRQPIGLALMVRQNLDLLKHHAGFTVWDNAAASRWYTWPMLAHPILLRFSDVGGGDVRVMSTIGNPVLWYGTTAALTVVAAHAVDKLYARIRTGAAMDAWSRRGWLILGTMFALIIQFVLTKRESYIWHYMAAYGIALAFVSGGLADHERRRPERVLAFLVLVAIVALWLCPVWTEGTISREGFVARLPFPGWR